MTTGTNKYEHSDSAPARDKRGRFQTGTTGNPRGRPRKQPSSPRSIQEALRAAFSEEVPVGGGGASPKQMMPILDVCLHKLVRGTTNAGAKDQLLILDRLIKLGVFDPPYRDVEEDVFTETDRRLIEIVERDIVCCCECGGTKIDQSDGEK